MEGGTVFYFFLEPVWLFWNRKEQIPAVTPTLVAFYLPCQIVEERAHSALVPEYINRNAHLHLLSTFPKIFSVPRLKTHISPQMDGFFQHTVLHPYLFIFNRLVGEFKTWSWLFVIIYFRFGHYGWISKFPGGIFICNAPLNSISNSKSHSRPTNPVLAIMAELERKQ